MTERDPQVGTMGRQGGPSHPARTSAGDVFVSKDDGELIMVRRQRHGARKIIPPKKGLSTGRRAASHPRHPRHPNKRNHAHWRY